MLMASRLRVIDLGGSIRKKSRGVDLDQNVFDIEQGVGIAILEKSGSASDSVCYGQLAGSRIAKYDALMKFNAANISKFDIKPKLPFLFFDDEGSADTDGYLCLSSIRDVFPVNSGGIVSGRDEFALDFDYDALLSRVQRFSDPHVSNATIRREFGIKDAGGYYLERRRPDAFGKKPEELIGSIQYRPFDYRFAFLSRAALTADQSTTTKNLVGTPNVALVSTRQTQDMWDAKATSTPIGHKAVAAYDINSIFPLWLAPQGTEKRKLPNISSAFIGNLISASGLDYDVFAERGDLVSTFAPRDVFDWIYTVLHSPAYRARYAEYLKSDFARIPLPGSREMFRALVPLGTRLVALHLLDSDAASELKDPKEVRFAGHGEARVEQTPQWSAPSGGRVAISDHRWFEGVPERVWNLYIGGYQPAQKWLKDRAKKGGKKASPGRVLTAEDQLHYRRMIVAMDRTIDLMAEIDRVIEKHGGWPAAFKGMDDDTAAKAAQ